MILLLNLTAVILLGLAAFGVSLPRLHLGWAGLTLQPVTAVVLPAL